MGIRKVGTPQEEKETHRARQAAIAKRARARAAKHKRWVKQYGSVGAGSMAETAPKGGLDRSPLTKKEQADFDAAKRRGAAALKAVRKDYLESEKKKRAKKVQKNRVKKASTKVVKKSKRYA